MQTFKGKLVAILGLSIEGTDSAQFFHDQGARVWCCDRRTKEELGSAYAALQKLSEGFQLGKGYLANLDRFDYIVRTPGMSLRLPELRGIKLTSATKLFFELCRAPIIGVTGTKGKGTTSTLVARMLEKDGRRVWLGGNVGVPLLSKIPKITKNDIVVLELSSFQLEDLTQSPHIAVVLKTTQEHLVNQDKNASNYHETREAYVEAKKSIVRYQTSKDYAVLNGDDPTSVSFAGETKATALMFSRTDPNAAAFIRDKTVYLGSTRLVSLHEIKLRGQHNLDNVAAASLAARVAGVPVDAVRAAATSFEGLEHRLEEAGTINGVLYINDSFSTVPETAIAALESFDAPIVLIAGGSEKGSDFTQLGQVIASRPVKTLIAIGTMTDRIVTACKKAQYKGTVITGLKSMQEIVKTANREARPGDVVLLSPACASFDMFANYKERGKLFKYEVSKLKD